MQEDLLHDDRRSMRRWQIAHRVAVYCIAWLTLLPVLWPLQAHFGLPMWVFAGALSAGAGVATVYVVKRFEL